MMDEGVDDATKQASNVTKTKKLIRCTFWPNCDKGEQCPYLHPNKPCTVFPNCPFGQKCHYVHPTCRYDGFCTRLDCPFTHNNIKRTTVPATTTTTNPATTTTINTTLMNNSSESSQPKLFDTSAVAAATTIQPTSTTSPQKMITPKITINKIQPYYSLVNNNNNNGTTTTTTSTSSTVNNTKVVNNMMNTTTTTPLATQVPNQMNQQQQIIGASEVNTVFSMAVASTMRPFFKPTAPIQPFLPGNQYTLINRTNTVPSIPIVSEMRASLIPFYFIISILKS